MLFSVLGLFLCAYRQTNGRNRGAMSAEGAKRGEFITSQFPSAAMWQGWEAGTC